MIYKKGRKKRTPPVKITREDIERAMLEFEGEIQYLKIEKSSFYKKPSDEVQPPQVH